MGTDLLIKEKDSACFSDSARLLSGKQHKCFGYHYWASLCRQAKLPRHSLENGAGMEGTGRTNESCKPAAREAKHHKPINGEIVKMASAGTTNCPFREPKPEAMT